jgi:hypothetical protein
MATTDGPNGSNRLEAVRQAAMAFIARRAQQPGQCGEQDSMSVIDYGSDANIQCEAEPLASATGALARIAIDSPLSHTLVVPQRTPPEHRFELRHPHPYRPSTGLSDPPNVALRT